MITRLKREQKNETRLMEGKQEQKQKEKLGI